MGWVWPVAGARRGGGGEGWAWGGCGLWLGPEEEVKGGHGVGVACGWGQKRR